jgi:hypothetical protein
MHRKEIEMRLTTTGNPLSRRTDSVVPIRNRKLLVRRHRKPRRRLRRGKRKQRAEAQDRLCKHVDEVSTLELKTVLKFWCPGWLACIPRPSLNSSVFPRADHASYGASEPPASHDVQAAALPYPRKRLELVIPDREAVASVPLPLSPDDSAIVEIWETVNYLRNAISPSSTNIGSSPRCHALPCGLKRYSHLRSVEITDRLCPIRRCSASFTAREPIARGALLPGGTLGSTTLLRLT